MNVKSCGLSLIREEVRRRSRIFFDGDWDGFVATALLFEAGFRGCAKPVSPKEARDLVAEDSILIELGPDRVKEIRRSILFDHHGFGERIAPGTGFVAFVDGSRIEVLLEVGKVSSVAELVAKVVGIEVPSNIMEYTNAVDSNPRILLDDPRYVGYRSLLDVATWKEWVSTGLKGVEKAMELHRKVGEEVLKFVDAYRDRVRIDSIEVNCRGEKALLHLVLCETWHEIEVEGFRIKPMLYLARRIQMELEEKNNTAYVVLLYLEPNGIVSRVSISCGPRAPEPANRVAEKLGGGGHEKVAGAPMNRSLDEALNRVTNVLREVCKP